ncbi:MAG: GH92 family glycosyl hydrolase [Bacteroidales bacterium]|nr:GH92 family glycosyl hydrolase [Bacteroidales bacterium]
MRKVLPLVLLLAAACTRNVDYTQYVNVFAGTDGAGHCHPCATTPFGAIQAGPQTGNFGWDYCGGYQWADTRIQGFSQNRISGTGSSELGDLLMQPFTGEAVRADYSSRFDKASERAKPGFYTCRLQDFGVTAEVSCTPHVAIHRYSADEAPVRLLLDLQSAQIGSEQRMFHRVTEAWQDWSDSTRVTGYTHSKAWNDRVIYYDIEFSRPYTVAAVLPLRDTAERIARRVLDFGPSTEPLLVKAAISVESVEGARGSIAAELPGWDFGQVRDAARAAWNEHLGRIDIDADLVHRRIFYTAMYHLMQHPGNIADAGAEPFYSTMSLWDTFRAAHPLFTLVAPEIVDGVVNSFLRYYEAQGFLPIWALGGTDNFGMIGNHSVPVIVDAWMKGFRGFDPETLYQAVRRSLTEDHIKYDWSAYDRCGFFPSDVTTVESVSRTLECGFDDWCAARMAEGLGHAEDADFFDRRAGYWHNVFDPERHLMRARDSQGAWDTPFEPFRVGHWKTGGAFTEGNAWQYTWHVLQDIPGLMEAMGGRKAFVAKLDSLFTLRGDLGSGETVDVSGLIGQYAHGNEPSHHVIYLYTLAGAPDKAADRIHEVWESQYRDGPEGLSGNDDCGQMSAWYILSALGFYPVNPCGGQYVIGAPQLPRMSLHLPDGKTFTVVAKGLAPERRRVASVSLNGLPLDGWVIRHEDILRGGTLEFTMKP